MGLGALGERVARTVADLATIMETRGVSQARFAKIWAQMFTTLESLNRVLLRAPA